MSRTNYRSLKLVTLVIMLTIFVNQLLAQTGTTGIFFQAVARDNYSNPAKERKIYVQSSIIQTTTNGTSLLVEEYQVNTDGAGMFSISIGNGIRVGGAATGLNAIDWSQGPFYLNLKIAITPVAGSTGWDYKKEWVDIGTTSFGAVPYALYSANTAGLNQKLNSTDTTKMLAPYARTTNVTSLTTSVASNTASISSLTTSAASNTASITSLTTSAASNTASITSLTTSAASNTASITSLTTSVASNTASITSNTVAIKSTVPYTGATGSVDLGAYNLTVNSLSAGVPSSGIQNTMFGYAPFVNGTPGDNNTAIGFATLQSLNGGNDNTAIGTNAIRQGAIGGAATGSRNTALGSAALSNGNVPSDNTAIGYNTLSVVTGGANTAVGSGALLANTTGSNNTAIGYSANVGSGTLSNATAIGAGATVNTSNTIQLGNTSVTNIKTSGTLTAGDVTYPSSHGTSGQVLSTTGSGTLNWTTVSSGSWTITSIIIPDGQGGTLNTASGFYQKIGNVVSFTFYIKLNGSSYNGNESPYFEVALPIASNFTSEQDATGAVSGNNVNYFDNVAGYVIANTTEDRLRVYMKGSHDSVETPTIGISGMYIVR
jgi:hypothetical protein